ncbi:MAG: class I SAM-dependent methyltransferase [Planctomycetota bacterium]
MGFSNSQGTPGRGTLVRLTRQLAVFEVYNPYSIVQLSEVLDNVEIRRQGRVIYQGRAVVSNLISTGLMMIVSVALVDPWTDLAELTPGNVLKEEARRFVKDWERTHALSPKFQLTVTSLANFLQELSRWLEGTEASSEAIGSKHEPEEKREFVGQVHGEVVDRLNTLMYEFDEHGREIEPDDIPHHKAFAQRILHPLTLVSPWINRTFNKPFGYAGDYEMLNMVMRDAAEGHNAYSKVLNMAILGQQPQQAYRNRIDMLTERLHEEATRLGRQGHKLRAFTVGCGPVNEVQRFLRTDPISDGCQFHMMDFNKPTLDFASDRVDEAIRDSSRRIEHTFVQKSIHELLEEAKGRRVSYEPRFDLVYCAGLFDYLSNRICAKLIKLFYSWVAPGGMVVVTNVANSDPILIPLEYIMEWYLIYRSPDDMLELIPDLGEQTVSVDETGINVFLEIRKPSRNA